MSLPVMNYFIEPEGKDTAAAIALVTFNSQSRNIPWADLGSSIP